VLLPVDLVEKVGWEQDVIDISLTGRMLSEAPVYDAEVRDDRKYLQGVADHYQRNV
jgi:hypothetical protein